MKVNDQGLSALRMFGIMVATPAIHFFCFFCFLGGDEERTVVAHFEDRQSLRVRISLLSIPFSSF